MHLRNVKCLYLAIRMLRRNTSSALKPDCRKISGSSIIDSNSPLNLVTRFELFCMKLGPLGFLQKMLFLLLLYLQALDEETDFSSLRSLQIIEKFLINYTRDSQKR